jgi:hypothetical protein
VGILSEVQQMRTETRTHISIFGAILTIISGCLGFAFGIYVSAVSISWQISPVAEYYAIGALGTFVFVSGLMGGECQLRRKHFAWSLICICSTLVSSIAEIALFAWVTNQSLLLILLSPLGLMVPLALLGLALTYRAKKEYV